MRAVMKRLNVAEDDNTACAEAQAVIRELLSADIPARLLACIGTLDFEARKDGMRLFGLVLRLGRSFGMDALVIEYVTSHPQMAQLLLEGCCQSEVFSYCAEMLRFCTRYAELVEFLVKKGALFVLLDLVQEQEAFDMTSEAFSSIRELLLTHKAVSSAYLQANFAQFFGKFNALLQVKDYVTRRQALRLLGEMLLDRSFMEVMVAYVGDEQFLRIHMILLRDKSQAIQLEAFHVFKIFVANPRKPHKVQLILYRNREKLLRLIETFLVKRSNDECVAEDAKVVLATLEAIQQPSPRPRADTNEAPSTKAEPPLLMAGPPMAEANVANAVACS